MSYTDQSLMPWGIHKGKKMEDVPDKYLLWLWENNKFQEGPLKEYVKDNIDAIKINCKKR